jgi:hypothetical protein
MVDYFITSNSIYSLFLAILNFGTYLVPHSLFRLKNLMTGMKKVYLRYLLVSFDGCHSTAIRHAGFIYLFIYWFASLLRLITGLRAHSQTDVSLGV